MPLTGTKTEVIEEGKKKQALNISFTNGALDQLEKLKEFIGTDDLVEVVKVGIAFVQREKERQSNQK